MKTISTHLITNNNGFNQSIPTRKLHKNPQYYQNYDQIASNINRNAAIAQVEYQRNACEEELYRLRYGIENLLANKNQDGFKLQQQRFRNVQNPFRTMTSNINNLNNRKNKSWIDRCSPCCRRWRRKRDGDNSTSPNENTYHHIYNDRNYDNPSHRTPEIPFQSQPYSDSLVSTSPSSYIDPNISHTRNDLRRSIDNLIDRNTPISKMDISNLVISKDVNDPVYNSLIVKILETKAMDCLCAGYTKQNTRTQIPKALSEMHQRVDEDQRDYVSVTSSQSSPSSHESSSVSSILTDDKSLYPHFITPQLSTQQLLTPLSSDIQTSKVNEPTSTVISPDISKNKIKSSLISNDNIKPSKKDSKVTIIADQISKLNKPKNKKKLSSKHKKNPKTKSKQQRKPTSTTKKRSKSKHSSSKLKKKASSISPSRAKSSKTSKRKNSGSTRKKTTKPKSNNQINDYAEVVLPTFIYPQPYQEVYRRPLKLLLSST